MDENAMKRFGRAVAVPVAAAILIAGGAGCGSSKKEADAASRSTNSTTTSALTPSSSTTAGAKPPKAKSAKAAKPKQVAVMSSNYGQIINAPGGHALYVFTQDRAGQPSTCYGECATKWPPFLVKQTPSARDAVKQGLLGTVKRRGGRLQATYAGRPLYFYVGEKDPGEVLCQAVSEFGGTWYVVAPGGEPVTRQ